jgi:hypothetical protein
MEKTLMAGFVVILCFFYYVFTANPYGVLSYMRIPLMFLTFIVVFGVLIFIEYYFKNKIVQSDSIKELGTNFLSYLYKYGMYLLYITIVCVFLYALYKLFYAGFVFSLQQSTWATLGLIVLVLALLNSWMGDRELNHPMLNLIKNMILYIPCILTDTINFLKKDYKNTPSTPFVVFGILCLYLLLFYILPLIQKIQYKNDGILLIEKPMYLNKDPVSFTTLELNDRILKSRPFYDRWFQNLVLEQQELSDRANFKTHVVTRPIRQFEVPPDDITSAYYEEGFTSLANEDRQLIPYEVFKKRVQQDFDASMNRLGPDEAWREYILNHPQILTIREKLYYLYSAGYAAWDAILYSIPSTKNATYYYHYALTSWVYLQKIQASEYQLIYSFGTRPSLYYDPVESTLLVILNYGMTNQKILYKTDRVLYQRWNFIVMNYNYGSLDLFINNNLVGTYPDIITQLQTDDLLIVGSKTNSSIGGICNMKYYELPLGIQKINSIYQRFHLKKIPI